MKWKGLTACQCNFKPIYPLAPFPFCLFCFSLGQENIDFWLGS